MQSQNKFDVKGIHNIAKILDNQVIKFNNIRALTKSLEFIPVESVGNYSSVTYKSIDGGKLGIYFDPFEFDFIVIADSYDNELIRYLLPKGETLQPQDFQFLDDIEYIKKFLLIIKQTSILKSSDLLFNPRIAMEITELSCIFSKLVENKNEPIILMKDGLLRTRALKYHLIPLLLDPLKSNKKRILIGVAKQSKVLNLISTALSIEKLIPEHKTGYIEIPWELEQIAYRRSKKERSLSQSFGKIYVAKLSPNTNLLVTIEIPYDFENDKEIYTKNEIYNIIGHLIKDSKGSYPILGYPQTIMRAHEKAVRSGITASIWREKIIETLLKKIGNKKIRKLMRDSKIMREYVKKDYLGGT